MVSIEGTNNHLILKMIISIAILPQELAIGISNTIYCKYPQIDTFIPSNQMLQQLVNP